MVTKLATHQHTGHHTTCHAECTPEVNVY